MVKLTVVENDVPQLLSIGLLEFSQAVIDTSTDQIDFKKFNTRAKMHRLPSGHRILNVAEWPGGDFPIPSSLAQKFRLNPGDFNLLATASEAYMAALSRPPVFDHFLVQVGLTENFLATEECVFTCDRVLGNFVEPRSFSEQLKSFLFRTTWVVTAHEACLVERNATPCDKRQNETIETSAAF